MYLCPKEDCFGVAIKRRSLARALGAGGRVVKIDSEHLWPALIEEVDREAAVLRRSGAGTTNLRYAALVSVREELHGSGKGA